MNASFRQAPRKLGARLASLHKRFVEANRISNAASTRFYLVSAAVFAVIGVLSWLWQLYNPPSPRPGVQPAEAQREAPEPAGPSAFRPGSNPAEGRPASPSSVWEAIRPRLDQAGRDSARAVASQLARIDRFFAARKQGARPFAEAMPGFEGTLQGVAAIGGEIASGIGKRAAGVFART